MFSLFRSFLPSLNNYCYFSFYNATLGAVSIFFFYDISLDIYHRPILDITGQLMKFSKRIFELF